LIIRSICPSRNRQTMEEICPLQSFLTMRILSQEENRQGMEEICLETNSPNTKICSSMKFTKAWRGKMKSEEEMGERPPLIPNFLTPSKLADLDPRSKKNNN
ncbi:hypothetical protein, partial [Enterobacter hormaechei]|uniref:hypothetical protein n=1 Tax=Enterobacter hormaechei TaxID=158836 RepID=UPI0023E3E996